MSKSHPKLYTKPSNSGYGYKHRDLALLETWARYWQKGRVKRRQNSVHMYPCLRDGQPATVDFFTITAEIRALDKTRNMISEQRILRKICKFEYSKIK